MMGVEWSSAEAIKAAYEEGLSMDGCCERDNPSNWEASSAKANLSKAMQLRPMEEAPKDMKIILLLIPEEYSVDGVPIWCTGYRSLMQNRWQSVQGDELIPSGWLPLPPTDLECK